MHFIISLWRPSRDSTTIYWSQPTAQQFHVETCRGSSTVVRVCVICGPVLPQRVRLATAKSKFVMSIGNHVLCPTIHLPVQSTLAWHPLQHICRTCTAAQRNTRIFRLTGEIMPCQDIFCWAEATKMTIESTTARQLNNPILKFLLPSDFCQYFVV